MDSARFQFELPTDPEALETIRAVLVETGAAPLTIHNNDWELRGATSERADKLRETLCFLKIPHSEHTSWPEFFEDCS